MEYDGVHLVEHAAALAFAARKLAEQLHCAFYEAGGTLRLSRRACGRANELLTDATAPGDRAAPVGHAASTALR